MKPIRILHVLGAMNRGGVETWLMHVIRHLDRSRFQHSFLVHTDQPAAYDKELQSLGANILSCPLARNPVNYAKRFLKIAKQFGPFDVLHSHVHYFSGFTVWLGRAARIPTRISHSHNDTRVVDVDAAFIRRSYLAVSRWLLKKHSTYLLAASAPAATALFGVDWKQEKAARVLHYGIDLAPFSMTINPAIIRSEFGFRPTNIVFGHVGRFDPQKNHTFLIDIFQEIAKREAEARLLLVGDGPLKADIEDAARRAAIADRIVFAGGRPDVSRLMMGAMDRFLFPSLYEGLGLVLAEAQAAGLPAIISDVIPAEADIIPDLITRLSLQLPAAHWAKCALSRPRPTLSGSLATIQQSPFNIETCVKHLMEVYAA